MKKIDDIITEILTETDEVSFRDLVAVYSKLKEDGYTDETIEEEFLELKRKLKKL